MAFMQHCFIRKNTPEIINRLKVLGIPQNDYDDGDRPWIAVNYGMWISVDKGYDRLFPDEIDCGENEELFFALIALRDDNDYMQWFVNNKNEFIKCERKYFHQEHLTIVFRDWHKATVNELIKYFNINGNK